MIGTANEKQEKIDSCNKELYQIKHNYILMLHIPVLTMPSTKLFIANVHEEAVVFITN